MFMPGMSAVRAVPALGRKESKIAIVGDFSDAFDRRSNKPFAGPAGTVLEQCLHQAGLIRGECYITNMVKDSSTEAKYFSEKGAKRSLTQDGIAAAQALYDELDATDANVIVACGNMPMQALVGISGANKFRGYFFESIGLKETRKVIPIIHPGDSIRGMYLYRHLISADLRKARQESNTRQLVRPERQLIYRYENVGEVLEWLDYYAGQPEICFDIEVINYAVSCISFSSSPDIACVIPIAAGWKEDEERLIWRGVQKVLGNPDVPKIGQNLIFDIQFLMSQCGVIVRGPLHDTMLAHSVTFPELQKGLGFLGSIYCGTQAYWKDKVKFTNIKDES